MNQKTKTFRITTFAFWVIAFVTTLAGSETYYHLFAALTAFSAALLIYYSKDTQGHYRNISLAYMCGSIFWGLEEILRFMDAAFDCPDFVLTVAQNISFIPLIFFCGGLLLFTQSEYNKLHFEKMVLHTFAIAFFAFMVMQKLVLYHYAGIHITGLRMFAAMVYFFVAVFTIVFIIAIFVQTNFKGHTFGTNCSAIMLTLFCLAELDRLYRILANAEPRPLVLEMIGLFGLVVFSYAQSDPQLIHRGTEEDELNPDEQVKDIFIIGNSGVFLLLGFILYFIHFFDTRDLYLLIIAVLSYATVFKSIQANVYNTQLLEHQMKENQRLEEMVEEKTRELREANEHLHQISSTDELTGLRNRRFGMTMLHSHASTVPFGLLILDLNHFKQVNDTYGHDAGDEVLREVGRRLNSIVDESITPIRLGGDEFLVLVARAHEDDIKEETIKVAEKICDLMDNPIDVGNAVVTTSACIGICFWPEHSEDIDELYSIADDAMYEIKHKYSKSSYKIAESKPE